MTKKNIKNIREFVWKIIDTDISLKKDLARDLLNVRSVASYIIESTKINASLDSVISAIRRYDAKNEFKEDLSAYNLLNQARINTRTKMASVLLKRTDEVKIKLGRPEKLIDYKGHDIVRIIEGREALTLVFDRRNFHKVDTLFTKNSIIRTHKKIGMIEISYPMQLEKTPGVFNIISSILAQNNISIIDAVISSNEHIILVHEDNLLDAFSLIYKLCK